MERLTHKRSNGIKEGYWSPNKKEELVKRLAEYENTGLSPADVGEFCRQQDRWIPVKERSPEDDSFVLVTVDGIYNTITFSHAIQLASYCEDDGWFIEGYPDWDDPEVTAWKPLPEPYKGGQNET
ncbi:MAG: DUF551 domain-containing protein [Clostridium sp.]|nr:DUF551 domain-containing protein [Clostridium sp.]